MVSRWVVNTSPILLLSRIQQLELLSSLAKPVLIPEPVADEIVRGGWRLSTWIMLGNVDVVIEDSPIVPEIVKNFGLGYGETAVLAIASRDPGSGAIVDDRSARNAAAKLRIPHLGTLGLVLLAKKTGQIAEARPVIEKLRSAGMYLSDKLMEQSLGMVGESKTQ